MFKKFLTRFKPLFKKFITVRKNIQNKKKLLNFRKKKWIFLKSKYEKKLRFFKKYKAIAQNKYSVIKFARKNNSYKKRYRNTFQAVKSFKLFYGNFLKKQLKKKIASVLKNQKKSKADLFLSFITPFENRLDVVLFRAYFCSTIRFSQQLIKHGKVEVNKNIIKNKAHQLNPGDLIEIRNCFKYQLNNICKDKALEINNWPHPPKYLHINYKTFQIIFGTINHNDISILFNFNLKLEKILLNYKNK